MLISLYIMAVSGVLSLILFFIYKAEAAQGKRIFLVRFRQHLDSELLKRSASWIRWKKYFGASSLRLFLHYLLHQGLSASLFVINFLERRLNNLRRKNKIIAKVVSSDSENHLHHIAEHKKSTALSDEEKEDRKERSMND
ncbi:hypothetical protein COU14_03135 [Candidatus Kaiserbacteria bacterium CG10_big_fil_rev_8_21_14_0_10_44_10]|uniref:Uncharacterized protein n=1 Tax=Candidatus Kaiserbacteria bacterium CG10_big_fil_rev_8_21_14_0_10_44_10 TaxID=1974606 RepID=A0A2H0UH14_9BACT|nr:MAG: hypothetical protein COU14_03135 [Candidatus Kaiserbacteria bacterium CG10_big_fil_rev_8_21_14_0_10_44_10]